MDFISIYCNYCWKEILEGDRVFITSCFHLYCDICMTNKIHERICPICDSSLMSKGSIYGITIGSTFEKTIQLFGLPPKNILMVAERVIEFYNYQNNVYLQSLMYQSQQSLNHFNSIKRSNDELNFKIESCEKQLKLQRIENENDKKEIVELTEKLAEKTRQKRKLEELYLTLKENMNNLNNSSFNNIYFNNSSNSNNSSSNINSNNSLNNNISINNSNNSNNNIDIKMTENNQNHKKESNSNNKNGFKLPFSTSIMKSNSNSNIGNLSNSSISPNRTTINTTYRSPSFISSPISIIKQNQNEEYNFINQNDQQSKVPHPSPFQKNSTSNVNSNNHDKFSFIKKSTPIQSKK